MRSLARKPSKLEILSTFLAATGVFLIAVAITYLVAQARSGNDVTEFTYRVPVDQIDTYLGREIPVIVESSEPIPLVSADPDVSRFANLYPGGSINPKYWSEPEWAGSDPFGGPSIPEEFIPVSSSSVFREFSPISAATRMRIPAINVDAIVTDLGIVDLGDSKAYETPDNVIGHIPETVDPGQLGSGWFFAHLESFAAGEGSIFRRLPELAEMIKNDPVDVFIETEDAEYIYRVTQTSQINERDLKLSSAKDAQITLVTCWPPRVYDQRILVDATLIAYKLG